MMEKLPQSLNAPVTVLIWESDQLGIFFVCLTVAIIFGGYPLYALCLAAPMVYGYYKRKNHKGFLKHFIYMLGLRNFKGYPSSFENHFME